MWRHTPSGDAAETLGVDTMWADIVDEVAGEGGVARRCGDRGGAGDDDAVLSPLRRVAEWLRNMIAV